MWLTHGENAFRLLHKVQQDLKLIRLFLKSAGSTEVRVIHIQFAEIRDVQSDFHDIAADLNVFTLKFEFSRSW